MKATVMQIGKHEVSITQRAEQVEGDTTIYVSYIIDGKTVKYTELFVSAQADSYTISDHTPIIDIEE